MKTRTGFVSNSSSSSFVVALVALTLDQIAKIKDYRNTVLAMTASAPPSWGGHPPRVWLDDQGVRTTAGVYLEPRWIITEGYGLLRGQTSMSNFDFGDFLIRIGVPEDAFLVSGGG